MFVQQMLPSARRRLAIASVNAPLAQVAGLLCQDHINLAVICDLDGGMVGVITDCDIVQSVSDCAAGSQPACALDVAAIMSRNVLFCHADDHLHEVWAAMKRRGLRHIPVLSGDDKPMGVLYARDVMNGLYGQQMPAEPEMLDLLLERQMAEPDPRETDVETAGPAAGVAAHTRGAMPGFVRRAERRVRLMNSMMHRVGVTAAEAAQERNGEPFASACRACMFCERDDQCADWLSRDDPHTDLPDFCPNAEFFRRTARRLAGLI